MAVVRCERDSRRWVSDLEVRRERWWVNWVLLEGAERRRDCWFRVIASVYQKLPVKPRCCGLHFDWKLVSVKLSGLGFALPTLSLGFCAC